MPETSEQFMRRFAGYWATRDAASMVACFAQDGVYDNVPDGKPLVGRAAIKAWLDTCFAHLTRIDVEILHCAVDGEWILSERLDDHIIGEKHMPLPVMNAARIIEGQIVTFRDYYCRKAVAELGMG
jgi:limonene-1,2-epoxide hydrolase